MSKLNWDSIKAWWFDPATKRLGCAVFISIFIHFVLIEQSDLVAFSNTTPSFRFLEAKLMKSKPQPASQIVAEKVPETVVPVANNQENAKPVAVETPNEAEGIPASDALANEAVTNQTNPGNQVEEPLPETQKAATATQVVAESEVGLVLPDTTATDEKSQPFTMVETDFDVLMNGSPARVGTAKIYYSKGADQRYELIWKVSATGLIGLVYPDLTQTSQGRIMEFGLMPDFYLYQFGEGESRSYQASFDWVGKEVALQSTKGTKTVTMDAEASAGHIQDFLSFMYQFMFTPPLDEMQMYLTNGRKLGRYTYAFEGEEVLALKFGNVSAYHIQHAKSDSDEKTELWLAKDYRYVPVRIRKTEKDGTVIEQVATQLKFETLENEAP